MTELMKTEPDDEIPKLMESLSTVYVETVEPILDRVAAIKITDQTSLDEAAATCREIVSFIDDIESKVKAVTAPLVKLHKDALRSKEAITEPLEEAVEAILAMMQEYKKTLPSGALPVIAGMSDRKVYKFEIVDAGLIPADFMTPDVKKIGEYVRKSKGMAVIDGVRIWTDVIRIVKGDGAVEE